MGFGWEPGTINTKPAIQLVPLFVTYAMSFVKRQLDLYIIVAAVSMMLLGGFQVFENPRPPEVPETLRTTKLKIGKSSVLVLGII